MDFMFVEACGRLAVDRIIFEAAYPVLFTCINEQRELFICVCCQNNQKGKKWLLAKTRPDFVVQLLKDEITVRDIFLRDKDCRISVIKQNGETIIKQGDENDWSENSIFLPKAGEYLDAEPGEFDEDIKYYLQYFDGQTDTEIENTRRKAR